MTDKIFDFIVASVRKEEDNKQKAKNSVEPVYASQFTVDKMAGDLVEPSRKKAQYHRERELEHTKKLELAEVELREKGVTTSAIDPNTGFSYSNTGSVCSGAISNFGGGKAPQFQAIIDQTLLGNVERAKNKMLEHRQKADQYAKYARAFALGRDRLVRLSIDDITYFGLDS